MLCVLPGGATLARAYCEGGNVLILLQSVGRVSAAPPGKKSGDMIAGFQSECSGRWRKDGEPVDDKEEEPGSSLKLRVRVCSSIT